MNVLLFYLLKITPETADASSFSGTNGSLETEAKIGDIIIIILELYDIEKPAIVSDILIKLCAENREIPLQMHVL